MLKTFAMILEENATRSVFESAVTAWSNRDLEGTLDWMSVDVIHRVNVDGELAPFAASVTGKAAMRRKLQVTLDTFEFGAYVTDHLAIKGRIARARMKMIFIDWETGERLNTTCRLVLYVRDGLIARVDEYYDAQYVESYVRLVASVKAGYV